MNVNHDGPVVVGVDGKEAAAIRYALTEARDQDCRLRVVHACRGTVAAAPNALLDGPSMDEVTDIGRDLLETVQEQVSPATADVSVEFSLEYSVPQEFLLEEAQKARLLVLGTDKVSWFDQILGGEVTSWLVTRAPCPVVVVPESWGGSEVRRGGVVVTIEGASSAHGPLAFAFERAERIGQSLHVLHVTPPGTREDDENEHRINVAEILAGWAVNFPDVDVSTSVVSGKLEDSIRRETAHASVVVVGRPTRHGFPFSLARPVAVSIFKKALCPVAVVPAGYEAVPYVSDTKPTKEVL